MSRISKANLDTIFGSAVRAAKAAGVNTQGWTLHADDSTSYRMVSLSFDEHLGYTMAEAYATLRAWIQALRLVKWTLDKQTDARNEVPQGPVKFSEHTYQARRTEDCEAP